MAKRRRKRSGLGWAAENHKVQQKTDAYMFGLALRAGHKALRKGDCETAFEKYETATEYQGMMFAHQKSRGEHRLITHATEGRIRLGQAAAIHLHRLRKGIVRCIESHCHSKKTR